MLYLVTGASASGKSEYAEKLAVELAAELTKEGAGELVSGRGGRLFYVATMDVRDEESRIRVTRHKKMREGKKFETIEQPVDIGAIIIEEKDSVILLEDLSNLLANEMYSPNGGLQNLHINDEDTRNEDIRNEDIRKNRSVDERILYPLLKLSTGERHLIVVTNEIFTGTDEPIDFTKWLGYLNLKLAEKAAKVIEVVDGIPTEMDSISVGENMKLTFVTGGICQGKTEYVKNYLPNDYVIDDVDLKMKAAMEKAQDTQEVFSAVEWIKNLLSDARKEAGGKNITVIGCENGCGLVPMDAFLRNYREENGRMNCYLAGEADSVIRMISGIPQVLSKKPKKKGRVLLIRHGATAGNLRKCFIGSTDEPLCETGIEELVKLKSDYYDGFVQKESIAALFASPMQRCRQTADIIFPEKTPQIVEELHECDFGIMDGKNHEEMMAYPEYRAFIEDQNPTAFPGGESIEGFLNRCADAFYATILKNRTIFEVQENPLFVFVIHGGTCMGILNRFSDEEKSYYEWNPQNGKGYLADLTLDSQDTLKLSNIQLVP